MADESGIGSVSGSVSAVESIESILGARRSRQSTASSAIENILARRQGNRAGTGAPNIEAILDDARRRAAEARARAGLPSVARSRTPETDPSMLGGFLSQAANAGRRAVTSDITMLRALNQSVLGGDPAEQDRLLDLYLQQEAALTPRNVARLEDIDSISDAGMWLAETLGMATGFIGTMGAGAAGGAVVPGLVARGGSKIGAVLSRNVLSGKLSEQAAKRIARRLAPKEGALQSGARTQAAEEAFKRRAKLGARVGAGTVGGSAGVAEVSGRMYDATGELHPEIAIPFGLAVGALDTILPGYLAKQFGMSAGLSLKFADKIKDRLTQSRLGRFGAGAATGVAVEMPTEVLQEAISASAQELVDENFDFFGVEQMSNFLNSAAAGAVGGAVFSGVAGLATQPQKREADDPPLTDEQMATQVAELVETGGLPLDTRPTAIDPTKQKTQTQPRPTTQPRDVDPVFYDTDGVPVTGRVTTNGVVVGSENVETAVGELTQADPLDPNYRMQSEGLAQNQRVADFTTEQLKEIREASDVNTETLPPNVRRDRTATLAELGRRGEDIAVVRTAPTQRSRTGVPVAGRLVQPEERIGGNKRQRMVARWDSLFPDGSGVTIGQWYEDSIRAGKSPHEISLELIDKGYSGIVIRTLDGTLQRLSFQGQEGRLKARRPKPSTRPEFGVSEETGKTEQVSGTSETRASREMRTSTGPFNKLVTGAVTSKGVKAVRDVFASLKDMEAGETRFVLAGQNEVGFSRVYGKQALRSIKKIRRLIETFSKKFMAGQKIVLVVGESYDEIRNSQGSTLAIYNDRSGAVKDFAGAFTILSDGTYVIMLNPNQYKEPGFDTNEVLILTHAVHELGHALTHYTFQNADTAILQRIYDAYDRRARLIKHGDLRSLQGMQASEMFEAGTPATLLRTLEENPEYWYSFDEWVAHQVATWMTTAKTPISYMEKFFHEISKRLKSLYNLIRNFVKNKPELKRFAEVDQFIESWMQSWADRENVSGGAGRGSLLQQAGQIAARRAQVQNLEVLGDDFTLDANTALATGLQEAPVDGPESAQVRQVFKSVMTKPEAAKNRAELAHYGRWMRTFLSIMQVARKNLQIEGLQKYVSIIEQWANMKTAWQTRADQRLQDIRKSLSKKMTDNLWAFLYEMDRLEAWPTQQKFVELALKHNLSEDALRLYNEIRNDFKEYLDEMERIAQDGAARISSDIARRRRLEQIAEDYRKLRARPYFPHLRFGEYVLVVRRAGEVVYAEQFASETEREAAKNRLRAGDYADQSLYKMQETRVPDEVRHLWSLPPNIIQMMEEHPSLNLSDQQRRWLEVIKFELAPERSQRKRMLRRRGGQEGVPGYSMEGDRVYASYFATGANHLARLRYADQLEGAIQDVRDELAGIKETTGDIDYEAYTSIIAQMEQHKQTSLWPGKDWANLRSVAFLWYLGFMPASAFLNLTQVPMVSLPYIAARLQKNKGIGRADVIAARYIMGAYRQLNTMFRHPERLREDAARALERATREQVVDESMASELNSTAGGQWVSQAVAGSGVERMIRTMGYYAGWMFQSAEKVNRHVTFMAAYEMALKNPDLTYFEELRLQHAEALREMEEQGWAPEQAMAYIAGKDAVHSTQFRYAEEARPEIMKGPIKSTVLTFYMFVQNMLFFQRYSPGRGRHLLLLVMMAGAMGAPGAEDADILVKFLARKLGIDFQPQRELREFVHTLGVNPDLVLRGAGRFGFGLPYAGEMLGMPVPSIDMSRALGLGNIIPGIQLLEAQDADKAIARGLPDAVGATLSIPINMFSAMSNDHPDAFRVWEQAMPRAMKSIRRGNRILEEGRETDRAGNVIARFDPEDPAAVGEAYLAMMGFTPTRLGITWDRRRLQQEAIAFWAGKRETLTAMWNYSMDQKDNVLRGQALRDIREFNRTVPDRTLRISRKTLKQSRSNRLRSRSRLERGLPRTRQGTGIAREINELFPSDPSIVQNERVSGGSIGGSR